MALVAVFMLLTTATAWAAVGDVIDSGTCGDNLTWTLTENGEADITLTSDTYTALTLTITGTGAMYDFTSSTRPWNNYRDRVTKLVLPDGITHIGNYAFYYFFNATRVTLPASVQSIGEKAFLSFGSDASSCYFTAATGSQLTSIGTEAFRAFSGNVNLRNCKSLTTIGEKAFEGYKSHTVSLPVSMRSIAKDAFYNKSYSGDKPKVYVAYGNSILYINDVLIGTDNTSGMYNITTDLNIKGNSSDAVSIRQYLTNSWGGGDGSSWEQAYVITNTFGLDLLAYYVNKGNDYEGKYYKLGADITYTHATAWDDVTSTEDNYTAIGNPKAFKGHFDGQGHTVNGIRIYKDGNSSSDCDQGLFGYIAEGAEVTNVTLADARITGYRNVGGIAGYSSGSTISNCPVHSNVCIHTVQIHYAWEHGGIVGQNYLNSTVSHCTSAAQLTVVSGAEIDRYGGIAGLNIGTLEYNLAIGATTPNVYENSCGIIVGSNGGTLTQNYYSGCTFADTPNATGKGMGGNHGQSDVAGEAEPGYLLTLAEGITSNALTVGSYTMAPSGQTVTLGHNRPGYDFGGYVGTGVTITDGAFTMPANDVTVSIEWTPSDNVALTATKIDGNYWTTFYCGDADYTINGNACAYTAEAGTTEVTLTKQGTDIPKGEAVIIVGGGNGTDATISISLSKTTGLTAYSGTNDLHGVDVAMATDEVLTTYSANTLYFLSNKNGNFGFHDFAGTTVPARKAFLALEETESNGNNARELKMVFGDTTPLLSPEGEDEGASPRGGLVGVWYSLDGRQLPGKPTAKGVYINNNRKVVVN